MFAGIVQQQGKLIHKKRQGKQIALTFEAQKVWDKPLKRGESISVSGVCLTVTKIPKKNQFTVQAIPETLARTAINHLSPKESVNLERSLTWGERIGGHFVLGHVDGVGRILRKTVRGQNFTLDIEVPAPLIPYLVPQGSIAVDGISFTLQKFWTFRDDRTTDMHIQVGKYFLVALVNLALNTALMYVLVDRFGIWYILSQIIIGLSIAVGSYFVYKKIIFRA